MKIGVVGAGAWGTALSLVCARSDNDVVLWSYDGMYKFFDGISMPKNISVISDYLRLKETDVWLVVTPAAYFRETMRKMRLAYDGQPVIICTKGAECSSGEFMSEIIAAEIPECLNVGVLSGPQFAAEVARGVPTGSTLAGNDIVLDAGHQALSAMYLSDSNDIIGAQICGVGKNAVALISGYCSVKCAGENERALRFTRAWDEVVNIGVAMGAQVKTFLGLCGVGDLFLSATSMTSRNYSGGVAIAKGEKPEGTVEGIFALCGLVNRARDLGIETPILDEMYSILKK
jgi:glycerol-3-phosphate dehydrogenase (NAD(P)+)